MRPKAAAYLSVTGYADVDAMGTTEREFDEAIKRFESEPMVVEVASRWREVGAILQNELFKRVNDHLDSEDMTDEHRTAVRDMVIDALTETLHED